MKILMLSEDFLPNVGGITSHIVYLSKALVEQGNLVTILKPSQNESKEFMHEFGFRVIHLKKRASTFVNKFYIRRFINNLFTKEKFDLLHWHQLIGYETKFLSGIPKVFTNHTSMYLEQYQNFYSRFLLKFMLGHVDAVISPSIELKNKSAIIPATVGNFYISNGVDEGIFNFHVLPDRDFKEKYSFLLDDKKAKNFIVLCPRRLEPKCGVQYFIEAIPKILEKFNKVKFVIAGRGGFFEEEKRFKNYLEINGCLERVYFLGDIENNLMPYLYNLSDLVVLPSLMEATSISCLEAMACGKAIISTNVGGLPELIEDKVNGVLVEPRNSSQIAEQILNLLSDEKLRKILGDNSRLKVENYFSWRCIAVQTQKVYEQVIKYYL